MLHCSSLALPSILPTAYPQNHEVCWTRYGRAIDWQSHSCIGKCIRYETVLEDSTPRASRLENHRGTKTSMFLFEHLGTCFLVSCWLLPLEYSNWGLLVAKPVRPLVTQPARTKYPHLFLKGTQTPLAPRSAICLGLFFSKPRCRSCQQPALIMQPRLR